MLDRTLDRSVFPVPTLRVQLGQDHSYRTLREPTEPIRMDWSAEPVARCHYYPLADAVTLGIEDAVVEKAQFDTDVCYGIWVSHPGLSPSNQD